MGGGTACFYWPKRGPSHPDCHVTLDRIQQVRQLLSQSRDEGRQLRSKFLENLREVFELIVRVALQQRLHNELGARLRVGLQRIHKVNCKLRVLGFARASALSLSEFVKNMVPVCAHPEMSEVGVDAVLGEVALRLRRSLQMLTDVLGRLLLQHVCVGNLSFQEMRLGWRSLAGCFWGWRC